MKSNILTALFMSDRSVKKFFNKQKLNNMKKLNQLENYTGGVCYDFQRTPQTECANICLFGAIDAMNIDALVNFVSGSRICIL